MPEEYDSFKPGTGLFEGEATIVVAAFVREPQRENYSVVFDLDSGEQIRYGLGSKWESYDGGETVEHPDGERKLFSNQSAYSSFMTHAAEAGAREIMLERSKAVAGQGAKHASTWLRMRFLFEPVEVPIRSRHEDFLADGITPNPQAGTWYNDTTNRSLPTKFLGLTGVSGSTASAAPTAPSAPSVTSSSTTDPLSVLDPVTAGKVRKAATDAADYNAFVDAILMLTDTEGSAIMEHSIIGQHLADENWYISLKG